MRPIFGDIEVIELLNLEKQYEGMENISYITCDCTCPHCRADLEVCPYCKSKNSIQFYGNICKDCGKEAIPYAIQRKIIELKLKFIDA